MTDQEREDFFQKVKGKKIRWHSWNKGSYFIPDLLRGRSIGGSHCQGFNGSISTKDFLIYDGFAPNNWELVNDNTAHTLPILQFEGLSQPIDDYHVDAFRYAQGEINRCVSQYAEKEECTHEYIDVGFMHPKYVCKKCDKEKK